MTKTFLTPEQYLEIERKADFRSEYIEGEMLPRSGSSLAHGVILANLVGGIGQQLRRRPGMAIPCGIGVKATTGFFAYPDVVVVCFEPQFADDHTDTLMNPTLVVEVISPSTEAYDRGRKFAHYRSIESLRAYLLVCSDRTQADLFTRHEDHWLLWPDRRDTIELRCIDCQLTLTNIYEKVNLC